MITPVPGRSNSRLKVFGLAQAAAIPRREGSKPSKHSRHSFYAAGAPRAAGRGGARDSRSRNRGGGAARSRPGRGRAQVRREARVSLKLTGFRCCARRLQSGAGGRVASQPRSERRGGLSFGAVAAAGSPSARRRRCCRMRSPSAAWLLGGVLPAGGLCLLQPHRRR